MDLGKVADQVPALNDQFGIYSEEIHRAQSTSVWEVLRSEEKTRVCGMGDFTFGEGAPSMSARLRLIYYALCLAAKEHETTPSCIALEIVKSGGVNGYWT